MDIDVASATKQRCDASPLDSEAAFAALVADHHRDLVRLAYAIVGDPDVANDVAQAAWTAAWRNRRRLREPEKVRQRQLGIGPRDNTQAAITGGQVDLVPEHIGSLLAFLGREAGEEGSDAFQPTGDSAETHDRLEDALEAVGLSVLEHAPAQDHNAFVVRPDIAGQYGLETMTDLAAVATELVWGLPPECDGNPLCRGPARGRLRHPVGRATDRAAGAVRCADGDRPQRGRDRRGRAVQHTAGAPAVAGPGREPRHVRRTGQLAVLGANWLGVPVRAGERLA